MTAEEYEALEKNVARLKTNRENVPIRVLRTKYAKGYYQLLAEISSQLSKLTVDLCICGLPVKPEKEAAKDEFFRQAQNVFDDGKKNGTNKKIAECVLNRYDLEEAKTIILTELASRIHTEAYGPYWVGHCVEGADGIIHNDLINMDWDPKYRAWTDGNDSFIPMFPPTLQEIRDECIAVMERKEEK